MAIDIFIVVGFLALGVVHWRLRVLCKRWDNIVIPSRLHYSELRAYLRRIGELEGGRMWFGRPDRWYATPTWRCTGNHVSRTFLKGGDGVDRCLLCMARVALTYPEDRGGPLRRPPGLLDEPVADRQVRDHAN